MDKCDHWYVVDFQRSLEDFLMSNSYRNKDQVRKETGIIIRNIRMELGFSQEELAFRADINRTFLSKVERGEKLPSHFTWYKLADALGVHARQLTISPDQNSEEEE